jgi:outer membrane protein OmpA-like peptidoglycan-associated protein
MLVIKPLRYLLLSTLIAVSGCATTTTDPYTGEQKTSEAAKGAGIGAVVGAIIGAASSSSDDRKKDILVGAAVGAGIGAGTGHYMDQQETALRNKLQGSGVQVRREGENIRLVMPGNITFSVDSYDIRSDFYSVLRRVALVIKEYDQTLIEVSGHTDSTGSFEHNQLLSENRANSVGAFLQSQGILASRLRNTGYGPRSPIASNATAEGRQQNRRVEIQLYPI